MIATLTALAALGKILGLSFVITRFTPLQLLFEVLQEKYPSLPTYALSLAVICFACCSFWIGLIMFDLWYACGAFFIATIFDKTVGQWLNKIKF